MVSSLFIHFEILQYFFDETAIGYAMREGLSSMLEVKEDDILETYLLEVDHVVDKKIILDCCLNATLFSLDNCWIVRVVASTATSLVLVAVLI